MMEWGHHIDAAMRELPEPQRAVVNAVYAEDRSMREIAEQQGVPVGTVKSRMRLAMKSLRLYFQQQGGLDAH
jgi:RNA polymerase sigma-70 factor (ECF subfamily)